MEKSVLMHNLISISTTAEHLMVGLKDGKITDGNKVIYSTKKTSAITGKLERIRHFIASIITEDIER